MATKSPPSSISQPPQAQNQVIRAVKSTLNAGNRNYTAASSESSATTSNKRSPVKDVKSAPPAKKPRGRPAKKAFIDSDDDEELDALIKPQPYTRKRIKQNL